MYDSDLSDTEWELIYNLFDVGNYVTPAKHSKRVLVNAVFYLADSGCKWRQLPKCFPKWKTVYSFFYRARNKGLWEEISKKLVIHDRILQGKLGEPSYGLIDSQSNKNNAVIEAKGFDGGKKK